jgi:uncharacterized membrane protein AbrB (regulator of aidB expression)
MTTSKTNIPLGVIITVGKLALILVVLYLLARFAGLDSVLWCAGGLAVTMIALPIVMNAQARRKQGQEERLESGQEEE